MPVWDKWHSLLSCSGLGKFKGSGNFWTPAHAVTCTCIFTERYALKDGKKGLEALSVINVHSMWKNIATQSHTAAHHSPNSYWKKNDSLFSAHWCPVMLTVAQGMKPIYNRNNTSSKGPVSTGKGRIKHKRWKHIYQQFISFMLQYTPIKI